MTAAFMGAMYPAGAVPASPSFAAHCKLLMKCWKFNTILLFIVVGFTTSFADIHPLK
jgi:hypothetical protein